MLALTHHFIVQKAAYATGHRGWFGLYLVLGDDIVIFNKVVADQYLVEMNKLGVGINLIKSVVSLDSFEFAKRIYHSSANCSPVSFKELSVAVASLEGAYHLFTKTQGKHFKPSCLAKFRGYGYRALGNISNPLATLPKHMRMLLVFLSMPGLSSVSFGT
jgi:hypothetical protein